MTSTNKILNDYLQNQKIEKYKFDDFSLVIDAIGYNKKVLDWFTYLQSIETVGWRPRLVTKKISKILAKSEVGNPVEFYALFCPSYKKGVGMHGFRTDDVGNTSRWGLKILHEIVKETVKLGIPCKKPKAIFFDVAIEQPEKTLGEINDMKINIDNFKKYASSDIEFELLSEKFPFLKDVVGYSGIKISPLPVPQKVLERIIERGTKFYQLFGWTKKQIEDRSEIIASSEALVGNVLRNTMTNSIMIYTPTMLERAQIYSGLKFESDPLPIIFPKHPSAV